MNNIIYPDLDVCMTIIVSIDHILQRVQRKWPDTCYPNYLKNETETENHFLVLSSDSRSHNGHMQWRKTSFVLDITLTGKTYSYSYFSQTTIIKLNILIMIMVGKLEIAHMKFSPNLNTRADWERHEAAMGGFSYKEILESRWKQPILEIVISHIRRHHRYMSMSETVHTCCVIESS